MAHVHHSPQKHLYGGQVKQQFTIREKLSANYMTPSVFISETDFRGSRKSLDTVSPNQASQIRMAYYCPPLSFCDRAYLSCQG